MYDRGAQLKYLSELLWSDSRKGSRGKMLKMGIPSQLPLRRTRGRRCKRGGEWPRKGVLLAESLVRKSGKIATREAVGWGRGGRKVNGEEIRSEIVSSDFLVGV